MAKLPGAAEPTQICPRCGVAVKVSEMEEHMRIELLDPKWRQQKAVFDSRQKDSNLLIGAAISKNLTKLSETRTDIFGNEMNETMGMSEEEKRKQISSQKVIWDGYTASAAAAKEKAHILSAGVAQPAEK